MTERDGKTSPRKNDCGWGLLPALNKALSRVLVIVLSFAICISPVAAQQENMIRLAVRDSDSGCAVVAISPQALSDITRRVSDSTQNLNLYARTIFDLMASSRFAAAREKVPAFGDWTFDWFQSYVLSYRVLGRLFGAFHRFFTEGWPDDIAQAFLDDVAAPVRLAFQENMRQAGVDIAHHMDDLRLISAAIEQEWQKRVTALRSELRGLPMVSGPATMVMDLRGNDIGVGSALFAAAPKTMNQFFEINEADAALVFRTMRPIIPRLGAFILRATEFGGLIFTLGLVGFAISGLPGFIVGAAIAVLVYWTIDWIFNRTDAYLNQAEFERLALETIDDAQKKLSENAFEAFDKALRQRLSVMMPQPGACP